MVAIQCVSSTTNIIHAPACIPPNINMRQTVINNCSAGHVARWAKRQPAWRRTELACCCLHMTACMQGFVASSLLWGPVTILIKLAAEHNCHDMQHSMWMQQQQQQQQDAHLLPAQAQHKLQGCSAAAAAWLLGTALYTRPQRPCTRQLARLDGAHSEVSAAMAAAPR